MGTSGQRQEAEIAILRDARRKGIHMPGTSFPACVFGLINVSETGHERAYLFACVVEEREDDALTERALSSTWARNFH